MDLKEAYRALDPARELEPNSPFYVSRPDNPVSRIITELQFTDTPRQYLLTGHRGTGKTTELNRIERTLEAHYEVRRIVIESSTPPLIDAIHAQWSALPRRSEARPVLLLIDGVDKLGLRDMGDRYFHGIDELRRDGFSIVCTIPLVLPLTEHFGNIAQSIDAWYFLPSIDLWTRDGARIESGWKTCRDILNCRTGAAKGLFGIIGRDGIFTETAQDILAENGAGIHRELLRLAQRACVFAAGRPAFQPITEVGKHDAIQAVNDTRNEYSLLLRSEDFDLLRRVEQTGQISGDPKLLRLVRDQLIVAYGGGSTWFDVHPIVKPLIADTRKAASR